MRLTRSLPTSHLWHRCHQAQRLAYGGWPNLTVEFERLGITSSSLNSKGIHIERFQMWSTRYSPFPGLTWHNPGHPGGYPPKFPQFRT